MKLKCKKLLLFNWSFIVCLSIIIIPVIGDDMDMEEPKEFHPKNAGSKSFHWILDLVLLLIFPGVAGSFTIAEKFHTSLVLHIISGAYSIFESLFLSFADNVDNHENRMSKGTGWFLTILLGLTVFSGSLVNGSNLIINRFYPHLSEVSRYKFTHRIYKFLSVLAPLTGWVRVCVAPIALFGFCYGKHTGQCIAHGIMGTAFVFYGFVLALVLVVPWIRNHFHSSVNSSNTGKSQEFYDSTLMTAWGIVNTFTEHRWGKEGWNHGDYQHTSMGIIWWSGGLLGMWLSRKNNTRTFVPAALLIYTGYAMMEHSQHSVVSTKVHYFFGLVLNLAGVCRIIEISFLLGDKSSSEDGKIKSFQHLPPLFLVLAGILFMSANEEQLTLVTDLGADHSSYILVVSSGAFLVYLFILLLLQLYLRLVGYDEDGELSRYSESGYKDLRHDVSIELDQLSISRPEENL